MTVILSPIGQPGQQFLDNNGVVLAGGLLYTYQAGTTTPQATFTDNTGGTPQPNPIVLDASGRVPGDVWLTYGVQYKFVLQTSLGVTLGTWDGVPGTTLSAAIAAVQANLDATNLNLANIAGCYVLANVTATQALAINAETQLHYNNKVTDLGNNYNAATWNFVAPNTGTYEFAIGAYLFASAAPTVGDTLRLDVFVNGALKVSIDQFTIPSISVTNTILSDSVALRLATGDVVNARVLTPNGPVTWTLGISGGSYLIATRIS